MRILYIITPEDRNNRLIAVMRGRGHFVYRSDEYADSSASTSPLMIEDVICDLFRESGNGVYHYDAIVSERPLTTSYLKNNIFPPVNRQRLSVNPPVYNLFYHVPVLHSRHLNLSLASGMLGCFNVMRDLPTAKALRIAIRGEVSPSIIKDSLGVKTLLPMLSDSEALVDHIEAQVARRTPLAKYPNFVKDALLPLDTDKAPKTMDLEELVVFVKDHTINRLDITNLKARLFPSRLMFSWYMRRMGWIDNCSYEMPFWRRP